MKKAIVAATAAVLLMGSGAAVYAQHRDHHARMTAEDMSAFADARIAAVKAGLKLTPDQEKLWPPLEAAVHDFAKLRIDRAQARVAERHERVGDDKAQVPDPVTRLRERADTMATTAAALKKIADAADPLYKTLDDGQKKRLAALTRARFGGPGWERHGFGPERFQDRGERDRRGPGRPGPDDRL